MWFTGANPISPPLLVPVRVPRKHVAPPLSILKWSPALLMARPGDHREHLQVTNWAIQLNPATKTSLNENTRGLLSRKELCLRTSQSFIKIKKLSSQMCLRSLDSSANAACFGNLGRFALMRFTLGLTKQPGAALSPSVAVADTSMSLVWLRTRMLHCISF